MTPVFVFHLFKASLGAQEVAPNNNLSCTDGDIGVLQKTLLVIVGGIFLLSTQ